MGPSDLDHVTEFFGLNCESTSEFLEGRLQYTFDRFQSSDMYGGRDYIVAGLPHIDMIVGMKRLAGSECPTEDLFCPIRNDFVGVHVRRGARTCLKDINNKLLVQLSVDYLLRRLNDCIADGLIK